MPCDQKPRSVSLPDILAELKKFDIEFNAKNSTISKQGVPVRKL